MTTATLAQLLIAIVIIAFVTSLAVEVEKKICNDFPNNILAICTSIVITVLAAIAYICYAKITVTPIKFNLDTQNLLKEIDCGEILYLYDWLKNNKK